MDRPGVEGTRPPGAGGQRPQALGLIYAQGRKNDRLDAENLARLARLDPRLLSPIEHRGQASQAHLAIVRSREALVGARTKLVNHVVRGAVKSFGSRLPSRCNAEGFHRKVRDHVPEALAPALEPILETIASSTSRIREYDRQLEAVSCELYPESALLSGGCRGSGRSRRCRSCWSWRRPVPVRGEPLGGGLLRARSRPEAVRRERPPAATHLQEGRRAAEEAFGPVGPLRRVLGPFAPDSDLRRHGLKIAERGGKKNAKKRRAVVAVARKLSVLVHRLWTTGGEAYEPVYNARREREPPPSLRGGQRTKQRREDANKSKA